MLTVFKKWYDRRFHDEEAILLAFILLVGISLIVFFSEILTPVIAALVLAFMFEAIVQRLESLGVNRMLGVSIATLMLLAIQAVAIYLLLTQLLRQFDNLVNEVPNLLRDLQMQLASLPERFPSVVSEERVASWIELLNNETANIGQWAVSVSQATLPNLISFMVYLVLVPILVFFFLKDKAVLLGWFSQMLPERRPLLSKVWNDMDDQLANYVRGKAVEMLIVGVVAYVLFRAFGLNYAALLAVLVGMSVIVPYVGAFIVTLPIVIVAYLQWGWGASLAWLFVSYVILQALDGNVLVPLIFSEAVNLHPVAIILAILFFGGIWGLWGVFFAIPLATLVTSVLHSWPDLKSETS